MVCLTEANVNHFLPKLGIMTLASLYVLQSLIYVKKNINDFTICSSVHDYDTRNRSDIYIDRCNYQKTQNSFHIVALNMYNSLPNNTTQLTLQQFTKTVKVKLIFNPLYSISEFYRVGLLFSFFKYFIDNVFFSDVAVQILC